MFIERPCDHGYDPHFTLAYTLLIAAYLADKTDFLNVIYCLRFKHGINWIKAVTFSKVFFCVD